MIQAFAAPLRVNIGVSLTGRALEASRVINQVLVARGHREIEFTPIGRAIPHVTYLMGTVRSEQDLSNVASRAEAFAASLTIREFGLSAPYLTGQGRGFVFSAVQPESEFLAERAMLFEPLRGVMSFEHHGGLNNPPHLTLGYLSQSDKVGRVLSDWSDEIRVRREVVSVFRVGDRGTCVEALHSFAID